MLTKEEDPLLRLVAANYLGKHMQKLEFINICYDQLEATDDKDTTNGDLSLLFNTQILNIIKDVVYELDFSDYSNEKKE